MNKTLYFPLKLQLFAEGEGAQDDPDTDTTTTDKSNDTKESSDTKKMFTQEEIDNIVKGRLAKERKNWEKELTDKQTEAEKLASMTEKEKKAYQDKKREDDLNKREAAIVKRELTAQAKSTLTDRGLAPALSDFLDYTDADSCNKSIDKLQDVFQAAVEKAVDEKMKGGKTLKKAPDNETQALQDEMLKNMKGM